jgi:hypothetical protein
MYHISIHKSDKVKEILARYHRKRMYTVSIYLPQDHLNSTDRGKVDIVDANTDKRRDKQLHILMKMVLVKLYLDG